MRGHATASRVSLTAPDRAIPAANSMILRLPLLHFKDAAFATLGHIGIGNRMIESMPYGRRIGRFRTSDTLLAPRYRADPRLDYASLSATTIPDNEMYMCVCSIGRAGGIKYG
jgi:hypothetical protein